MVGYRFSLVFLVLFASLGSTVGAFTVLSPSEVIIQTPTAVFETTIVNNSTQEKALDVTFFAPMRTEVTAPPTVKAQSEAIAQIKVYNFVDLQNTEYQTRLAVLLGNENASRNLVLSFKEPIEPVPVEPTPPTPPAASEPPADTNQRFNSFLAGMATFLNNPTTELALQAVLVVIIIVFAVAFIARLYHRAQESSK